VPALFFQIRDAVIAERYVTSLHAIERLREREVLEWQIIEGIGTAEVLENRPADKPAPTAVVRQVLANGDSVVVVWAWNKSLRMAKIVTVYFEE
jgi:hypothetical protein